MQSILDFINWNFVFIVAVQVLGVLFLHYGKGKISDDLYSKIEVVLSGAGSIFRSDKIKAISDIALKIVTTVETFDKTSADKHALALDQVTKDIGNTLNVKLDQATLDKVIKTAVTFLETTNKK
jgi:hypothetical protein